MIRVKTNIKVCAPASIANLAGGYNNLALCLEDVQDEIVIRSSSTPGVRLSQITSNKAKLSLEDNVVNTAAQAVFNYIADTYEMPEGLGLELELKKGVPVGLGLGSSAASAVAAVMAVNEALGTPLEKRELLSFALEGERLHNPKASLQAVATSLIGGVVAVSSQEDQAYFRLPLFRGLQVVVLHPSFKKKNPYAQQAKKEVPAHISTEDMVQYNGQFANLIQAFYMTDIDLLRKSFERDINEDFYAAQLPFYTELKADLLAQDALACGLLPGGQAVFALCKNQLSAEEISTIMQGYVDKAADKYTIFSSGINHEGAYRE